MDTEKKPSAKVSDHILQTSSNLLGLCFLILSLLKINKLGDSTRLDELLIFPILLFFSSSILSYFSLRRSKNWNSYEILADRVFILGLFSITLISLTFIFELIM